MPLPFLFIGVLSLALGLGMYTYLIVARPDGPVSGGVELAAGFAMIGFGSWVVWRRIRER